VEYIEVVVVEVQALVQVQVYIEGVQVQELVQDMVEELEQGMAEEQVQVCIEEVLEQELVQDMVEEQGRGTVEVLVAGQEYKQAGR
jgi:Rod binding domain-containing protein